MKPKNSLRAFLALAGSSLLAVACVHGQDNNYTGANSTSTDRWNTATNWSLGTVPTGAVNVVIPASKQTTGNSATTPTYTGNLTLGAGAYLGSGYGDTSANVHNVLGTAGSTTIYMGAGSKIAFRGNHTPAVPSIVLQGNAEITMGSSTAAGTDPVFGHGISGNYTLTLNGKSDCTANINAATSFGHLLMTPLYGTGFTVNANLAGSLGGNVTLLANTADGTKGANLNITVANAMSNTATLSLYGTSGKLVKFDASDTIGALKLNGVKQLAGSYTNTASWLEGSGTVTVAAPAGGAYWNVNSNANLGATQDATGIVFGAGNIAVSGSNVRLIDDAVISVGTGSSANISSAITEDASPRQLHKVGAGTLTLSGSNSFTGALAIGQGTVSVASLANAGAASPIGQFAAAGAGGMILGGGRLQYTGGTTSTNRGFTLSGNSAIDVSSAGTTLTLGSVETYGVPGTLTVTGGAGSRLALGNVRVVEGQGITLNPLNISMTVASVEGYSSYPLTSTVTLGGSSSGNVVTGSIFTTNPPGSAFSQNINVIKSGSGEWIFSGSPTYSGTTTINDGKLVFDYTTNNTSKTAGAITLAGGNLELKGGSHIEVVSSTALNAGGTFITRDSVTPGTAKLRMNVITRAAGGTISFADASIADTDTLNTNGILGGYATLGANWARNSTGAGDGTITALSTYDTWTNSGGAATANYLLSGADSLGGSLLANTVKIANTGNSQTLDLGANNLTVTTTSATALGGILYAGGSDSNYSITGTGRLLASTTTGELIVHTHTGNLTIDAPIVTSGATAGLLTKSGQGRLIVNSNNAFTGAVRVNEGVLRIGHANATGSNGGGITVRYGAALEITNGITVVADALTLTGTGVSDGGALRNVSGTNTYQGGITIGSGGARINADNGTTLNVRGITTAAGSNVTFGGAGTINHSTTAISGAGGIVKDGAGTLNLNIANTYSGATTVSEGTLALGASGSIPNSSTITVATGATLDLSALAGGWTVGASQTLGGTGTVLGNTTVLGTHSPGNSPGILTHDGNLAYSGGNSQVNWELAANSSTQDSPAIFDQIVVTGNLDFTGATALNLLFNISGNVDWNNSFWDSGHSWLLYDVTGTTTNLSNLTINTSNWFDSNGLAFDTALPDSNFSLSLSGQDVMINYIAIPEPAAALLGGIGILLILRRRR